MSLEVSASEAAATEEPWGSRPHRLSGWMWATEDWRKKEKELEEGGKEGRREVTKKRTRKLV